MSAAHESMPCAIRRLRLYQFRNYTSATVAFGSDLNVIAGANAQGKTNLLEAAATLALARSPRAAEAADLVQWGASESAVEATLSRRSGDTSILLRLERTANGHRVTRTTLVDGKPRAARSILGLCPVVMFWPDDLQLVKAGPDARRRLLDVLLAQLEPVTAVHLARYRRVLEQRNALLHRLRVEGRGGAELDSFTQELVHHGARVAVARARATGQLAPLAAAALRQLSAGVDHLELRYLTAHGAAPIEEAQAEADLRRALRARATEEVARGVTVVGPHRDDVAVTLGSRPARSAASQGQQRSIVLALKLAEMRYVARCAGAAPVVMLDDVLSELDARRRELLLTVLTGSYAGQVLLTTTEPLRHDDRLSAARHFSVVDGTVTADT